MTFMNGILIGAIGVLAALALFLGGVILGHRIGRQTTTKD